MAPHVLDLAIVAPSGRGNRPGEHKGITKGDRLYADLGADIHNFHIFGFFF